jgi:hypothetical protein
LPYRIGGRIASRRPPTHRAGGARTSWRLADDPDAGCGAVSMGATDDPVRMRNGMIQINAAARLPPKEFAQ